MAACVIWPLAQYGHLNNMGFGKIRMRRIVQNLRAGAGCSTFAARMVWDALNKKKVGGAGFAALEPDFKTGIFSWYGELCRAMLRWVSCTEQADRSDGPTSGSA